MISANSRLIGKTLSDLQIKQSTGAMILAIKNVDGRLNVQPGAKTEIKKGDIVVALAAEEGLNKLRDMI